MLWITALFAFVVGFSEGRPWQQGQDSTCVAPPLFRGIKLPALVAVKVSLKSKQRSETYKTANLLSDSDPPSGPNLPNGSCASDKKVFCLCVCASVEGNSELGALFCPLVCVCRVLAFFLPV